MTQTALSQTPVLTTGSARSWVPVIGYGLAIVVSGAAWWGLWAVFRALAG